MDVPVEELAGDLETLGAEWDAFDRRSGTLKTGQIGGGDFMVRQAATKLREQATQIDQLRAALTQSADDHDLSARMFAFYVEQHNAKSPPDSAKAATNETQAHHCALASRKAREAANG